MPHRLGRHGAIAFLFGDDRELLAIADELHRKEPVPLRELHLPERAGGVRGLFFDVAGPSFAAQAGIVGPYRRLNDLAATLEPPFALDVGGFEHTWDQPQDLVPRRDVHYYQLDRPGSAALVLTFVLDRPFRYELECPGIRRRASGFTAPSGIDLWLLAETDVDLQGDRLCVELEPGTHTLTLVVWSRPTGIALHDRALVVSPDEAWIAATAQSWLPSALLPMFAVSSEVEMAAVAALVYELGSRRVVVTASAASHARRPDVAVLPPTGSPAFLDSLATELALEGRRPLDGADPALALADSLGATRGRGIVVCDSRKPFVRVLAAAYAAVAGFELHLLDAGAESPIEQPTWGSDENPADGEPLPIRIERHRVALAEQVNHVVPNALKEAPPVPIVAVTQGFAYPLVRGRDGAWGETRQLGTLPEDWSAALLFRGVARSTSTAEHFSVALLLDALWDDSTELEQVAEAMATTVARPLELRGDDAAAEALELLLAELPLDLVTLVCHGEGDALELADGPLISSRVAAWTCPSAPVVLNNSCSSWFTTGPSFLRAGAHTYIGTFWPVSHAAAVDVSASLVRALVSTAEVPVADALRSALRATEHLGYDDRLAYVLVGLPTAPARLAPTRDEMQRADLAEYGLIELSAAALRLAGRGAEALALSLRDGLIEQLRDELHDTLFEHEIPGHMRVHNAPGEHLDAIVGTYDAALLQALALGVTYPAPKLVDRAVEAIEAAVAAWEATGDDQLGRTRARVVLPLLSELTVLLARAGRHAEAWRAGLRAATVALRPSEPVPAAPADLADDAVVAAAVALPRAAEHLNVMALTAAALGRTTTARVLYRAALKRADPGDPAEVGRLRSNLAQLDHREGDLDAAAEGYVDALALLRASEDTFNAFLTSVHRGRLLIERGEAGAAESLGRQLLASLDELPADAQARGLADANLLLIQAIAQSPRRAAEQVDVALEWYRRALATGPPELAWDALWGTFGVALRAFKQEGDPAPLARAIRTASSALGVLGATKSDERRRFVEWVDENQLRLTAALDPLDAIALHRLLTHLSSDPLQPELATLVERAFSTAEEDRVRAAATEGWRRSAIVLLSPSDGRARTMIVDAPPTALARPVYVRYPVLARDGIRLSDAHVENVDCWGRTRSALVYRVDGDAALVVLEKIGQITRSSEGYRYRQLWGSLDFTYEVRISLPSSAVLTGFGIALRGGFRIAPPPRVGIAMDEAGDMQVLLEPAAEFLPWFASFTVEFAEIPALHELFVELMPARMVLPLAAYADALVRARGGA